MKRFLPFVSIVVLAACASKRWPVVNKRYVPPGTIVMADNFYVDRAEITNFNWMEYLYHTSMVYGKNSPEYLTALPDTSVWIGVAEEYKRFYHNHPVYRNYPVVGVSWKQACDFSKWRSDRVMQALLVKKKIIEWNPIYHPDSVFTIERYFNGRYLDHKPDMSLSYPVYSLPDSVQWEKISRYADSLYAGWIKKNPKKAIKGYMINSARNDDKRATGGDITAPEDRYTQKPLLLHIKGNVRELGAEKGISYGGSWKDSISTILNTKTYPAADPNAWTGFRNVCTWKTWDE